jgi:hypothetical protein
VIRLLSTSDLPTGFEYPREFVRIVELGLTDLEPWLVLEGERLAAKHLGLRERFPLRSLVPFASRQDNDDVACWDLDQGSGRVVIVHDYASPGWERRAEFATFNDWLRQAVEDLIAFAD